MSSYSSSDNDNDDRTISGLGGGPTGSPGEPCGAPDLQPIDSNTSDQPQATAPAGSSTNNQPRPEDFMGKGGY